MHSGARMRATVLLCWLLFVGRHGRLPAAILCAIGLIGGCRPQADTIELATNGESTAAIEDLSAEWARLVEQARREARPRIDSDLALGDAELGMLAGMTHLREIALSKAAVSDQALDAIESLS